jgi:hypothetical protein
MTSSFAVQGLKFSSHNQHVILDRRRLSRQPSWLHSHAFLLVLVRTYSDQFLATFKDYPFRQKAASFSIDRARRNWIAGR